VSSENCDTSNKCCKKFHCLWKVFVVLLLVANLIASITVICRQSSIESMRVWW
jgi:cell division protein FtsL